MGESSAKKLRKEVRKEAVEVSEKLSTQIFQLIHAKALQATNSEKYVKDSSEEVFNADTASGGNFDDAYELGTEDGEVYFARLVLREINKLVTDKKADK